MKELHDLRNEHAIWKDKPTSNKTNFHMVENNITHIVFSLCH